MGTGSERLHTLAAWRETPTSPRPSVPRWHSRRRQRGSRTTPTASPDAIWDEAARHYSESQLAALVVSIAAINAFNRLNAATRQMTGPWVEQIVDQALAARA